MPIDSLRDGELGIARADVRQGQLGVDGAGQASHKNQNSMVYPEALNAPEPVQRFAELSRDKSLNSRESMSSNSTTRSVVLQSLYRVSSAPIHRVHPCRLTLSIISFPDDQRLPLRRYESPVRDWQVQEIYDNC